GRPRTAPAICSPPRASGGFRPHSRPAPVPEPRRTARRTGNRRWQPPPLRGTRGRGSDPRTGGASSEPEVTFEAVAVVSVVGLVSIGGGEVTAVTGRKLDGGDRGRRRFGFG